MYYTIFYHHKRLPGGDELIGYAFSPALDGGKAYLIDRPHRKNGTIDLEVGDIYDLSTGCIFISPEKLRNIISAKRGRKRRRLLKKVKEEIPYEGKSIKPFEFTIFNGEMTMQVIGVQSRYGKAKIVANATASDGTFLPEVTIHLDLLSTKDLEKINKRLKATSAC